eukprot:m.495853 g.495853  ORF g.495853 m.495853 type:complete len:235 (-) comp45870_c0_seq1:75-779(-)
MGRKRGRATSGGMASRLDSTGGQHDKPTGSGAAADAPSATVPPQAPLHGVVVALSASQFAQPQKDAAQDSGCPAVTKEDMTYAELKKLAGRAGAMLSGTVHRNVDCLVATATAVRRSTQRVRKAAKFGVCVVTPGYLEACCTGNKRLDPALFAPAAKPAATKRPRVEPNVEGNEQKELEERAGTGADTDMPVVDNAAIRIPEPYEEKVLELGCCCSCHDSGETSCDWCIEGHKP